MASCKKTFVKTEGAFLHGKWFCCEDHGKQDPSIQKIIEIQQKLKSGAGPGEAVDSDDEDYVIDL